MQGGAVARMTHLLPLALREIGDRVWARSLRGPRRWRSDRRARRAEALLRRDGLLPSALRVASGEDEQAPTVIRATRPDGEDVLAKVAWDASGARRLVREQAVLSRLHATVREDVRRAMPRPLGCVRQTDGTFTLQTWMPGTALAPRSDAARRDRAMVAVAEVIAAVHRQSARSTRPDEPHASRGSQTPLATLRSLVEQVTGRSLDGATLGRLATELDASDPPDDRRALTHGDLWLGNVLLDRDDRVLAVLDWESGGTGAPFLDALHLVLTTRRLAVGQSLGRVVADVVARPAWSAAELTVVRAITPGVDWESRDGARAVLWYWLAQVEGNRRRRPQSTARARWFRRNIVPVLECL